MPQEEVEKDWEKDFRRLWYHGMAVDEVAMLTFIRVLFIPRSEIEKLARDIDNFQLHKFTHLNEIGSASLTKHQIADYVRSFLQALGTKK